MEDVKFSEHISEVLKGGKGSGVKGHRSGKISKLDFNRAKAQLPRIKKDLEKAEEKYNSSESKEDKEMWEMAMDKKTDMLYDLNRAIKEGRKIGLK